MTNTQPEPSMEEILASIRRIISEDEEEGASGSARPSAAVRPDFGEKQTVKPVQTARADDDGANTHLETEDVEMIKKNVAAAVQDEASEAILDPSSEEAATAAFSTLSQSVRVSDGPGKTLEDIVIEMLKPMVKEWLNANLPAIVEEKVEEEVQRVARRRRG